MGRLVGDGAMYWYLQEIIILPQFQRKGIGTMIVNHLVDYAKERKNNGLVTNMVHMRVCRNHYVWQRNLKMYDKEIKK